MTSAAPPPDPTASAVDRSNSDATVTVTTASASSAGVESKTSSGASSPTKRATTNVLGLGLPELATPSKPMTILSSYPHLGHYVHNLVAQASAAQASSPPKSGTGPGHQHPLSVSSSGESDDEDSDGKEQNKKGQDGQAQSTEGEKQDNNDQLDRDALVKKIVDLLDNEEEEEVKALLKPYMGDLAKVRFCSYLRITIKRSVAYQAG